MSNFLIFENVVKLVLSVGRRPGMSNTFYAKKIKKDYCLTNRNMREIEDRGIVYKEKNGRKNRIFLTEKGIKIFKELDKIEKNVTTK